jgi:FlaA1/EpsC-like NDP-sugar epimerase
MSNIYYFLKFRLRWLIFAFDILLCGLSTFLAIIMYEAQSFYFGGNVEILLAISLVLTLRISFFIMGRTFAGIIKYTSTKDMLLLKFNLLLGTLTLFLVNFLAKQFTSFHAIPALVLIGEFLISTFFLVSTRVSFKLLYYDFLFSKKDKSKVVIYGDDQFALMTKHVVEREQNLNVVAFFGRRKGSKLDNIHILDISLLDSFLKNNEVDNLIIAKSNITGVTKSKLFEICINNNVKVMKIPDPQVWTNGELSFKQLKKVQIEELLGREPIQLDVHKIKEQVTNKVVLVTGACGSIGSEIVRQLTEYHPTKIILVDQAESPMYDLELELTEKLHFFDFKIFIGDVTDKEQMQTIFDWFRPHIVYHAAAYKHVPMMEKNPIIAVKNNVFGTKVIADLSDKFGAQKFIMVSTDKAVNPTNVMGATKRIAEIYTQSLNRKSKTSFITTRFGNVLGSNGSVIPRFKQQIEEGGPITVTHPEITRYFMTIPEACRLVLEASAFGEGGEIFLFDMGSPVKIVDLAKNMVRLSGLELGKDISLKFTGLRPGEKLYEELLAVQENTLPTHHPKIMVARVREYDFSEVIIMLNKLNATLADNNSFDTVKQMKIIVPEFISQNSKFEVLDKITH